MTRILSGYNQSSKLQTADQNTAAIQKKTAELEQKIQKLEAEKQKLEEAEFTGAAVTVKKTTAGTKKIKVTWKKLNSAKGYEISYALKSNFKGAKKVTTTKTKKTLTKLKSGKKYYVRVRAYKNVNGKKVYTKYSTILSVKVK